MTHRNAGTRPAQAVVETKIKNTFSGSNYGRLLVAQMAGLIMLQPVSTTNFCSQLLPIYTASFQARQISGYKLAGNNAPACALNAYSITLKSEAV